MLQMSLATSSSNEESLNLLNGAHHGCAVNPRKGNLSVYVKLPEKDTRGWDVVGNSMSTAHIR